VPLLASGFKGFSRRFITSLQQIILPHIKVTMAGFLPILYTSGVQIQTQRDKQRASHFRPVSWVFCTIETY